MKLSEFEYPLPMDRIAREPLARRDESRLLVDRRGADRTEHVRFSEIHGHLRSGDLLVLNDTRVRRARLFGRRRTGGRVEFLLIERVEGERSLWRALAHPARRLKPGEKVRLERGGLALSIVERAQRADGSPEAELLVEICDEGNSGLSDEALLERHGHVPLPPYLGRADGELDAERYQTVYARRIGAAAAPTAGLHFAAGTLERLSDAGVEISCVTLHVGPGTFQPVKEDEVERHRMHSEPFDLSAETADAVRACRERGGRVIAVGTTSCRVLETCAEADRTVRPRSGETSLFILPGYEFRVVDGLLTNFHLPRSTLLMLVCAFAGRERVLCLYREAIERGYRFYSYGDAMLLLE
jgi:S-adenosylmethionine:tRNA ribosyltransferase-isomerase